MVTFREWMPEQEKVYEQFRLAREAVGRCGIVADPVMTNHVGGSFVHFCHGDSLVEQVVALSRQVAGITPAVAYDAENVHTTIAHCVEPNFVYRPQDNRLLYDLVAAVARGLAQAGPAALRAMRVTYKEVLFNQTAVIAAGMPNEAYFNAVQYIAEQCQKVLPGMSMSWGSHITLSRFLQRSSIATARVVACDLLEWARLEAVSQPVSIRVGFCETNDASFRLRALGVFPMSY